MWRPTIWLLSAAGVVWATTGCGGSDDARTAAIRVSPTSGLVTTEHGQEASFEVVLNSPDAPTADVVIDVASDNEAEGTVSPASLTFSPEDFDQPQIVTITGVDDTIADGHARFTVELGATDSSDSVWDGLDPPDVEVMNFDNDGAAIAAALVGDPFVDESGASTTMAISLSIEPLGDVSLNVGTSDTGEGITDVDALTFTPDDFATVQMVTITGVDDDQADGMQTFSFVTQPATSTDLTFDGLDAPDQSLLNLDNDSAGVLVVAKNGVKSTYEAGTPVAQVELDVRLTTQPTGNVEIGLSSDDTSEGEVGAVGVNFTSLTFTPANWDQLQTAIVIGIDDDLQDGEQNYTIDVSVVSSDDDDYAALLLSPFSVRNIDDDQVGILATPIQGLTTNEGGTQDSFDVQLATQPLDDVTIDLTVGNPAEGSLDSPSLVFTDQNWFVPQTVTITGLDDQVADNNQLYFITASSVTSNDADYQGQTVLFPAITVTNNDDDTVGIAVNPSLTTLNTSESGLSDSFTVVLTTQPTAPVVIDVQSSDESEVIPNPAQLTFDDSNWNNPQTVAVNGVDDAQAEPDTTEWEATIQLGVTSADGQYMALDPEDPLVINADDDQVGVTVTPLFMDVSESELMMLAASQCPIGGFPRCASYSVRLNTQPNGDVAFDVNSSDPGEAVPSRTNLVFDPQNYNTFQKVTVCGLNDGVTDGTQSISIRNQAASGTDTTGYIGFDPSDVSVAVHDSNGSADCEPDPKTPTLPK